MENYNTKLKKKKKKKLYACEARAMKIVIIKKMKNKKSQIV